MPSFEVRQIPVADTRPLRHAVLRPHQSLEDLAAHESAEAFAVGAFADGELVAVGFVMPDGQAGSWRIRGMATVPYLRGRGAGSAVLAALVEHAEAGGASRIWCNARINAVSLYERGRFRVISERFEVPDIGPHVVMELRAGDIAD